VTLQPGMTLAHYRLDRKIGAGGMGEVWRATGRALEREAKLLAALHRRVVESWFEEFRAR